jgi:hypothetical protein
MAKKPEQPKAVKKPEQPKAQESEPKPRVLSPAEWAPLNKAFACIKAAFGSRDLAERDLLRHLQHIHDGGALSSARRHIARDGTETIEVLEPSFWSGLTIMESSSKPGTVIVYGGPMEGFTWFFVRCAELDTLYPPRPSSPPSVAASDPLSPSTSELRAKARAEAEALPPVDTPPGPKPLWKRLAGREITRRAIQGASPPTTTAMVEWLADQDCYPEPRQVRDLIRELFYMFDP